jgi:hypothetical protein
MKQPIRMTFQSPFHTGSMTQTSTIRVHRREAVLKDGQTIRVPAITGTCVAGRMRRLLFDDFVALAGLEGSQMFTTAALALFCDGGTLSPDGNKKVDLPITRASVETAKRDLILQFYDLFPYLELLGFSWRASSFNSRAALSYLWLDCEELGTGALSIADQMTRVDNSHLDSNREGNDEKSATQMAYKMECIKAGATVAGHWRFINRPSVAAQGALHRGWQLLNELGSFGARNARGFGDMTLDTPINHDLATIYCLHVQDRAEDIRRFLNEVIA